MVYNVIGLMSGSSLDGMDIAYVRLEEVRGKWNYELICADCIDYNDDLKNRLKQAISLPVADFLRFHTEFGRYSGQLVRQFVDKFNLSHKVHLISSHGHTVFHEPGRGTTFQLGEGAAIAAVAELPVVCDLRAMDVASGGQGAPIVPVGDKMLFKDYPLLLNIGGIANITICNDQGTVAFDVCPANQVLNVLAAREGKEMDEDGNFAAAGILLKQVFEDLEKDPYYSKRAPKSLSNEEAIAMSFPALLQSGHRTADLLHTYVAHIVSQIVSAISVYAPSLAGSKMLVTGGGAFNKYLIQQLQVSLTQANIEVYIPDAGVVKYKEAIVMALIGVLRWREETNVLCSATGAEKDTIGGALWMV